MRTSKGTAQAFDKGIFYIHTAGFTFTFSGRAVLPKFEQTTILAKDRADMKRLQELYTPKEIKP